MTMLFRHNDKNHVFSEWNNNLKNDTLYYSTLVDVTLLMYSADTNKLNQYYTTSVSVAYMIPVLWPHWVYY